jgi:hypothetical protein
MDRSLVCNMQIKFLSFGHDSELMTLLVQKVVRKVSTMNDV